MLRINENEVAWIAQHQKLGRLVALATSAMFMAYLAVDWMMDPTLPARSWHWRVLGAAVSLGALPFLARANLHRWAPLYIAVMSASASVLVSVIFQGVYNDGHIAVIAQMQVLMALAVFAALRTAVRATLPVMLLSVNAGLWWNQAHWQTYALANLLMVGAAVLLVVISETAYRTFSQKRMLESQVLQQAAIVQTSDDAIVATDLDGHVTSWNAGASRLLGYSAQEMMGRTMASLLPEERQADERAILEHVGRGQSVTHYETTRLCKDGSAKDISVSVSPLRNARGQVVGVSAIARDISERKRIAQALHAKDTLFRTAIETTTDGFWATDSDGALVDANQAYSRLSGYTRQELLRMHIHDLDASGDPYLIAARMDKTMQDGSYSFEAQHRRKDGTVWPVEITATYSALNGGQIFVFTKDLTERKRAEERSWHQANFDSLTNLPNRSLLFDRLAQECAVARRNNANVAVMFADLDGFKQVNDRLGHAAGDWVLQEVARRWLASVREVDTVARLGGDEFAIVIGGLVDTSVVGAMAEKLIDTLRTDMELPDGARCRVGVSIGICFYPGDATAIDSLISLADAAMYTSKSRGRNTFTFCGDTQAPLRS